MRMFPSIAIVCLLLLAGGFVLVCVPVSCQVSVSTPIKLSGIEYFVGVASVNGQAYASGFTSTGAGVVWELNLQSGMLIPIAGSGSKAYIDGIGTTAAIEAPSGLAADPRSSHVGDLYFADVRPATGSSTPSFIRKLTLSTLNVTTVLGNGVACEYPYSATPPTTPTPALQSTACGVTALTMDGNGNLYYLDEVVLRVFNVDSGLVQTLVGSYGGNPGGGYVAGSGTSAYMPGPSSVTVLSDANGSEAAWISDGSWIHQVNVSVSAAHTLITPTWLLDTRQNGKVGFTCASIMNPGTFYMLTGCFNGTSGQFLSGNPTTMQFTLLGGGGACATTDGGGLAAGFTQPSFCVSLGGNTNGETLIVADTTPSTYQGSPIAAGAIRLVSIGSSPVTIPPSSTTPSPGGGGHPSAAATFAVSVGTLFISAVTVAVSVIAAAAI